MKEPFDIWWDENMTGFGVSDELRKLLANAFAGGMEASSGMKSVAVKKMSYTDLRYYLDKEGRDPYQIGEPEIVAIWPLPPAMAKEIIHRPVATSVHSSPTEKLRSFMGDIKWGDLPTAFSPPKTSAEVYDPSADTWKTRTGSTDRIIGAEVWHTTETYEDMSREERDRDGDAYALHPHNLRLLRRGLRLSRRDAGRQGRAHGTLQGRQGQRRSFVREGPLCVGLRHAQGSHHQADDPREDHRSLARSDMGRSVCARRIRVPAHSGRLWHRLHWRDHIIALHE